MSRKNRMFTQDSFQVDGFELAYRIDGTGADAIVIGSSIYYERTFSQNLRQHLRMVFMDHRGFGKALRAYDTSDFELDVIADDIEALRQHLGFGKVILIGHSGHGHMALAYAKKYPQNVSHVVMIALSPASDDASFAAADRYLEESVCPERKALLAETMSHLEAEIAADPNRRFIHYSLCSGPRIWYDYTYDAAHLWDDVEVIPEMFDHVWGKLLREIDITDGLERVTMPVLVALGRYDYWNPPHLWGDERYSFCDLRLRIFEHSGHTPQLEDAVQFDRELLMWLAEKTPEASKT